MAGKLAQASIGTEYAYAITLREVSVKPNRLWSARMRVSMPTAEKLLCMSGHDALFARPVLPHLLPAIESYSIIWGHATQKQVQHTLPSSSSRLRRKVDLG